MNYLIKSILLLIFLPSTFISFAQDEPVDLRSLVEMDDNDEMIQYREVIKLVASPALQYERAMKWANDEFINPLNVLKVKDKENFVIEGRESFRVYEIHPKSKNRIQKGVISYTFKLEFKDNRYRYTFTDFKLQKTSDFPLERWLDEEGSFYNPANAKFLEQINEYILNKILSLEDALNPPKEEEDDW